MTFGSFHTVTEYHHFPVPHGLQHSAVGVIQDKFLDDQFGVPLLHCRDEVLKDLSAVGVTPVVKDEFHVVYACAYDIVSEKKLLPYNK